jgi:predicted dehydrogenase
LNLLRAAVVGLGRIGMGYDANAQNDQVHTHCRAFALHPLFELVAGVDTDGDRRAEFEAEYGPRALPHVDHLEMMGRLDVVAVSVPTSLHRAVVDALLKKAPPRLVLVEKPLAQSREDAQALVKSCSEAQTHLVVNYIRQVLPETRHLKAQMRQGKWGKLRGGEIVYNRGFMNNASHFAVYLHAIWGLPARWTLHGSKPSGVDHDPDLDIDVVFGGAPEATISFRAVEPGKKMPGTVRLTFEGGMLGLDDWGETIWWQSNEEGVPREALAASLSRYQWHMADYAASLLAGGTPMPELGPDLLPLHDQLMRMVEAA